MIVKGAYSELLRSGIRWLFFCEYYPKRRKNENGSRYYRKRKKAYEEYLKTIPKPDEDEL